MPVDDASTGGDCAPDDETRWRSLGYTYRDADGKLHRWVPLYRDQDDGDGVGAGPRSIQCLGDTLPAGWSLLGFDPDDASSAVSSDADAALLLEL